MNEFASPSLAIELNRISLLCEEEWQAFLQDMAISPVPERQDLRAYLLNWVAEFIPEAFPQSLIPIMGSWLVPRLDTKNVVCDLSKPALIGSALFSLTECIGWIRIQLDNFAYGGSVVRSFLHNSLALAAPHITFDQALLACLELGMKTPYFFMDVPLALYAVSKGNVQDKMANLRRWQQGFLNPQEREFVDGLLKSRLVANPLHPWLARNTNYVAIRMACFLRSTTAPERLSLGLSASAVWKRIEEHPLSSAYLSLEPLNSKRLV